MLFRSDAVAAALRDQIAKSEEWQKPIFPVSGKDLLALGVKPGPAMGERLRELERRWIDSDFTFDRDALLGS